MKKFITSLCSLAVAAILTAQAPNGISYQSVIRSSGGTLITNQNVGIKISILQGSASGTAVYAETQSATTNANGLASTQIGSGTVVSGNFANIDWANGPFYIKTETDPSGGTNYSITGTSQLLSVPYALHARTAETVIQGSSGFTHYIGEQFGGGVVFHLWKDNAGVEHGLIIDIKDISTSQVWSNISNVLIGPTAQSTWDGLSNSNAIVGQTGHTSSAAKLCLDLVSGGQSDWYLPSIDELSILWHNHFNVNKTLSTISGATTLPCEAAYWSSTEYASGNAWFFVFVYGFSNGTAYGINKNNPWYVRAVRAF